jgi:3-oxoadipate enol-lactonase
MPHIAAPGCRLHYRLDGLERAPVLLFSNSLGCDIGMWDSQVAVFSRTHRVLRCDTRGHGQSEVPPGPYTLESLGRDLVSLLDALHIERVHFCGLSLGGMIGMWMAVNAPHRLERIVLANTSARLGPPEMWNDRIDMVRAHGMSPIADIVLQRWFTPSFRLAAPDAVEDCRRMLLGTSPEGYASCCAVIRDMDQVEAISRIATPTLVVIGEHDPATPPAHGQLIASRIPQAITVRLPAAHLSNIETAPAFTAVVAQFLAAS